MTGKRIAITTGAIAIIVIASAVVICWRPAWESYFLQRIENGNIDEKFDSAKKLAQMRSARAEEFFLKRTIMEEAGAIKLLFPIDNSGQHEPIASRVADIWDRVLDDAGRAWRQEVDREILARRKAPLVLRIYLAQRVVKPEETDPDQRKSIDLGQIAIAIATFGEGLESDDPFIQAASACGLAACGPEGMSELSSLERLAGDNLIRLHVLEAIRKVRGDLDNTKIVDEEYQKQEESAVLIAAFRLAITDWGPTKHLYILSYKSNNSDQILESQSEILSRLSNLKYKNDKDSWSIQIQGTGVQTPLVNGVRKILCTVEILKWISRLEVEFKVTFHGGVRCAGGFWARAIKTEVGWDFCPGSVNGRWNS